MILTTSEKSLLDLWRSGCALRTWDQNGCSILTVNTTPSKNRAMHSHSGFRERPK